jgi:hypothetical protein
VTATVGVPRHQRLNRVCCFPSACKACMSYAGTLGHAFNCVIHKHPLLFATVGVAVGVTVQQTQGQNRNCDMQHQIPTLEVTCDTTSHFPTSWTDGLPEQPLESYGHIHAHYPSVLESYTNIHAHHPSVLRHNPVLPDHLKFSAETMPPHQLHSGIHKAAAVPMFQCYQASRCWLGFALRVPSRTAHVTSS